MAEHRMKTRKVSISHVTEQLRPVLKRPRDEEPQSSKVQEQGKAVKAAQKQKCCQSSSGGSGRSGGSSGGSSSQPRLSTASKVAGPGNWAAEEAAVLRGFRARLDGPVVFVGDSIAEELAQYLQSRVGLKEVSWCTKRGAMPVDIGSQLRQWLAVPHNHQLLTNAGLLIVCAGKNLARTMPSLIAVEVHKHLITPLQKLCAGHKILVGPLTREYFDYAGAGAGSGDQGAGSSASRRSERSGGAYGLPSCPSLLHRSNLELERRSLDGGFGFVNLFGGRLSVDDFRDNLHLKDEGYLKMLRAVLEVMGGEGAHDECALSEAPPGAPMETAPGSSAALVAAPAAAQAAAPAAAQAAAPAAAQAAAPAAGPPPAKVLTTALRPAEELPTPPEDSTLLSEGDGVEEGAAVSALDVRRVWCDAHVVKLRWQKAKAKEPRVTAVKLRFEGWDPTWDEWVLLNSGRVRLKDDPAAKAAALAIALPAASPAFAMAPLPPAVSAQAPQPTAAKEPGVRPASVRCLGCIPGRKKAHTCGHAARMLSGTAAAAAAADLPEPLTKQPEPLTKQHEERIASLRRQLACASQATVEATSTLERAALEAREAAADEEEARATYKRALQRATQAHELVRSLAKAREAAQQQQAVLEEELEKLLADRCDASATSC